MIQNLWDQFELVIFSSLWLAIDDLLGKALREDLDPREIAGDRHQLKGDVALVFRRDVMVILQR